MKKKKLSKSYPCRECQAGVVRQQHITYFTWLNDELITVPNFPAWVCDLCGKRDYDERAISWLSMLLNPNAGRASTKKKIQPQHRSGKSAPSVSK
ncbi:MAG: YgiT-type zinc finger protein [Anaerolineae bacterium]|jgi:YgiT-type zinc finger domain-containing protein|nr:YgiT-type zinc finger protein [Anaerolineae bacterium]MBT3712826.1 YgiT-type zinc finger protein [Anaerolineae bacterium]MBT4310720.1 YgiT-type zinc finger protein [Anaerolineae bacterium]MBT4841723.1 YgiT-type zinc finger protein [Anaerolineae bacterium]MBT6063111.1 YgiT-type zinc finger protein [Anaerolineae bacterium]